MDYFVPSYNVNDPLAIYSYSLAGEEAGNAIVEVFSDFIDYLLGPIYLIVGVGLSLFALFLAYKVLRLIADFRR